MPVVTVTSRYSDQAEIMNCLVAIFGWGKVSVIVWAHENPARIFLLNSIVDGTWPTLLHPPSSTYGGNILQINDHLEKVKIFILSLTY